MTFDEYQKLSRDMAVYPNQGNNVIYPTLGLVGEAGEVAEKMKKVIRDHNGQISQDKKEELKKELGDVLWYITQLSVELGHNLEDVAKFNIKKLQSRKDRGKIHGDGDNR